VDDHARRAVQRWPVVPKADHTIPSTARSTSGVVITMIAFFPPELEVDVLEQIRRSLRDRDPGLARAGEP